MFIQFVCSDEQDLSIPEKKYSFGILKNAQAIGDYKSLCHWKRRVLRIDLGSDAHKGLEKFYGYLKEVIG
jgi:hypothetical protein